MMLPLRYLHAYFPYHPNLLFCALLNALCCLAKLFILRNSQREAIALSASKSTSFISQPDSLVVGETITSLAMDSEDRLLRIGGSNGSVSHAPVAELKSRPDSRVSPWEIDHILPDAVANLQAADGLFV